MIAVVEESDDIVLKSSLSVLVDLVAQEMENTYPARKAFYTTPDYSPRHEARKGAGSPT